MTQPQHMQSAKKTKLDDRNLKISGEKQNGSKYAPQLQARLVNNNPRIFVYTNIEGQDKPIVGNMDSFMWNMYMNMFEDVLKHEGKIRLDLELKDKPWDRNANKRSETMITLGTLSVGRDDDGMIYTCLIANNRPKCKFIFKPPYFCEIRKSNGEAIPDSTKSEIAARAWSRTVSAAMDHCTAANYKHPEPKQPQGGNSNWGNKGGNSGGGNNWGGKQGGGGGNQQSFDDVAF